MLTRSLGCLLAFGFASLAHFDWLCLVEFLGFNLHTRAWLLLGLLTGLLVLFGFLDLRGLRALLALLDLLGLLASLCLPLGFCLDYLPAC